MIGWKQWRKRRREHNRRYAICREIKYEDLYIRLTWRYRSMWLLWLLTAAAIVWGCTR